MSSAPQRLADILTRGPVIAVLTVERAADAVGAARALGAGGVRVIEVTLRTRAGLAAVRAVATACPDVVVGAGTARSPADLRAARDAGAAFAVSPGFTPSLAAAARELDFPWLPGVASASEIMAAGELGLERLKLFPAEPLGGPAALRAFGAVFPDVSFCPTGGITVGNAAGYLALPNVACVAGSWLAPAAAVAARDWRTIEQLARDAAVLPRPGAT